MPGGVNIDPNELKKITAPTLVLASDHDMIAERSYAVAAEVGDVCEFRRGDSLWYVNQPESVRGP
jgi:hypothetical protein